MMKRNLALVVAVMGVVLCIGTLSSAQSLSPADRDRALKYLESTKAGVIEATKGLSPAQLNFKPSPERWSVAEVLEHITAAEDMLYDMISQRVMKAPPRPAGDDVASTDEFVLRAIPDRSKKAQAPEPLIPSNRYGSPEATLKHFGESRERTMDFLRKTEDLRAHATDSPQGKKLDAYEWILYIAAHSERHTKQINEVKSDPNFPKM